MTRMDAYRIEVSTESNARRFLVTGPDGTCRDYRLPEASHPAYLDWHAALARDFGTRLPLNRRPAAPPTGSARFQALIVDNLSPRILYGYGDPAVLKVETAIGPSSPPTTRPTPSPSCAPGSWSTGSRRASSSRADTRPPGR
ncbi:hypothetical protein [Azohydromonas caseinilytica]|uniref:hypothetical protein n=1 Tax=Azohydromonas caseinilytica TaxID=2728836 RepID=UPI001F39A5B4|nr:hypothetical protein [Azohydromonas caseinilytica]